MKPNRICLTTKWLLSVVVVLALFPCVGSAWGKDFPSGSFMQLSKSGGFAETESLFADEAEVDLQRFKGAVVEAKAKENVMTLMASDKKGSSAGESPMVSSAKASETSLCNTVSKMIADKTIDKYTLDSVVRNIGPGPYSSEYRNLDIDRDGIADKVTYSTGSGGSLLEIQLSGGGEYDLGEDGFTKIVKINEEIYALVTYWEVERQSDGSNERIKVGNSLYRLTKHKAVMVCGMRNLKRR